MTSANEKMNYLLAHAEADVNLVAVCYQLIKAAPVDEQSTLLENFFVGYKATPTTGELKLTKTVSILEKHKYMLRCGELVDPYLEELVKQNPSEKDFYTQLWAFICESPAFPNETARVIALFDCTIDKRLPYFKLDRDKVLSMENDEYMEIYRNIGGDTFAKLEFILNANFDQKTEQASLIIQMMDKLQDYTQRCVLFTRIISHYQREMLRMQLNMSMDALADN